MRKNNPVSVLHLVLFFVLLSCQSFSQAEMDPLNRRKFNVMLDEVKDGVPTKKTIKDVMYFKSGRLFSDYLYDKYQYKWIRYRINKDSIFTDSTDTEVRYLEIEASITDEANQSAIFNLVAVEWDIDGTIKITKNDKVKRYFDVVGREIGGKPKKEKKKDKKVEVNPKKESDEPKRE
ncbi:MAG TPA: hypothetical protein PLQ93_09570 [Bacteroidia bacterium]|nr:hypothetical protein [Bacteroidia bacterium]